MRKSKHFSKPFLVAASFFSLFGLLASCQGSSSSSQATSSTQQIDDTYEFVFTGTGRLSNGRTVNVSITGNKDSDNSLNVSVSELPALGLTGTWVLVEGKGYKIYLNDPNNTLAYSYYDTTTKTFSLTCSIDMGTYGSIAIDFTYLDEAFASEYDGVGLGAQPPVFTTLTYAGGIIESGGYLTCAEDNSFTLVNTTTAGWYLDRSGQWSYNESDDTYILTFTDDFINSIDWETKKVDQEATDDTVTITYAELNTSKTTITKADLANMDNSGLGPYVASYDAETNSYLATVLVVWNWGTGKEEICTCDLSYAKL